MSDTWRYAIWPDPRSKSWSSESFLKSSLFYACVDIWWLLLVCMPLCICMLSVCVWVCLFVCVHVCSCLLVVCVFVSVALSLIHCMIFGRYFLFILVLWCETQFDQILPWSTVHEVLGEVCKIVDLSPVSHHVLEKKHYLELPSYVSILRIFVVPVMVLATWNCHKLLTVKFPSWFIYQPANPALFHSIKHLLVTQMIVILHSVTHNYRMMLNVNA